MKIQKNKMLGGGVDRVLSTSNNNKNESNGLQNEVTYCNNQSFHNDIVVTQKTNCKNENKENNNLCIMCNQTKIKNRKEKLHELLTVDFARYNRANNGDKMNTQFNKENFEQNNSFKTQKGYSCNKVIVNNKNKSNVTYKKQHNILQSTVILLSWLFVFVLSTMLIYFTNLSNNNNTLNIQSDVSAAGTAPSGSCTKSNPYQISSASNLQYVSTTTRYSQYWGTKENLVYYELKASFTYSSTWTPIGDATNKFYGVFNGNNYTVTFSSSCSKSNTSASVYVGFFGYLGGTKDLKSEVKNLKVSWSSLSATSPLSAYAGGIAGYANYANISGCQSSGTIKASCTSGTGKSYSSYSAGGIAGGSSYSNITNCSNSASINANNTYATENYNYACVGGICGDFGYGSITGCTNSGSLSVTANTTASFGYGKMGGIIGEGGWNTILENCNNSGSFSATSGSSDENGFIVGGIGGDCDKIEINNCHNSKSISLSNVYNANLGGIIGEGDGEITNCYNNVALSVSADVSANVGGILGDQSSSDTIIKYCYNTSTLTATASSSSASSGGIVGCAWGSTIYNCYNEGSLSSTSYTTSSSCGAYAGGLIGYDWADTSIIMNSYNIGSVKSSASSQKDYSGGLIGQGEIIAINSYNSAKVTASDYGGGICGYANSDSQIINCFSVVSSSNTPTGTNKGGILGYKKTSSNVFVENCYYSYGTNNGYGTANSSLSSKLTNETNFNTLTWTNLYPWDFQYVWQFNTSSTTEPLTLRTGNITISELQGEGTEANPYLVKTQEDLDTISKLVVNNVSNMTNAYFRQENTINYTGTSWMPIGNLMSPFKGNYDGQNYSINFTQNLSFNIQYIGVFGYANGAKINNLGVNWNGSIDIGYSDNLYLGGIAGSGSSTITNCSNNGAINVTINKDMSEYSVYVGGINGSSANITNSKNDGDINVSTASNYSVKNAYVAGIGGNVKNSYNTGNVTANGKFVAYVSGIAYSSQYNYNSGCYNTGTITAISTTDSAYAGGIFLISTSYTAFKNDNNFGKVIANGVNDSYAGGITAEIICDPFSSGTSSESYNTGTIQCSSSSGTAYAGGIVGRIHPYGGYPSASLVTLTNCYNTGAVNGDVVGGIVGANNLGVMSTDLATITNCYNTGTLTGSTKYGIVGNGDNYSSISNSYYINTCGGSNNAGSTALTLDNMKTQSSYSGWDFSTVWGIDTTGKINEGLPYLRAFYVSVTIQAGYDGGADQVISYGKGQELVLSDDLLTRDGYRIIGWMISDVEYEVGDTIIVESEMVITPIWEASDVNVLFNITTNMGVIFTITDNNGYVQQVFIDGGDNAQSFTLRLGVGEYKVMISTFYTTQIELLTANSNQVLSGRMLTLSVVGGQDMNVNLKLSTYVGSNWVII